MYIYNYLICVTAQVILAAIVWRSAYMDERKNKLYFSAIILNVFTLLGYVGRELFNDGQHFLLNYCTNFVIYLSASLLAYCILLTSIKKGGLTYKIVSIFEVIIIAFVCSSPLTHLTFYIDANGFYERGILYSIFFIQHSIYIILWMVCLAIAYKHVERAKRFYILLLACLELFAVIFQMLESDFKVIYVGAAFFLGIYYAFMMEVEGRYDQMTGVYSKRFYYSELERLSVNNTYIVFMLDANGLKTINDTMGHEYGDKVIETVGQIAWKVMSKKAKIFRIGGDEFVGISTSMKEDEMKKSIEEIDEKLVHESQKLGFDVATSIGYAIHNPGEEFMTTFHRADEYMYKVKAEYYEKTGKKRRV